jgi:hypothetical protein
MATRRHPLYGLIAEFDRPEDLLAAAKRAYAVGYRRLDAFTPLPVEGLAEAVGFHKSPLPLIVLIGGACGCCGGFLLQYWGMAVNYPLNIAGRPLNSWPAFIPITFEMTILFAALACVFGLLALNGLPTPYHPVFNAPRFELASRDRFFLVIKAGDARFDREKTRQFLGELRPKDIVEVEA